MNNIDNIMTQETWIIKVQIGITSLNTVFHTLHRSQVHWKLGLKNIDNSSTGQNWTVRFAKPDNLVFSDRIKQIEN
jgi:hypothetical protein